MRRFRRWYWQRIRRYDSEICSQCGRPVGLVWWCSDNFLWEAVTGHEKPPGKEPAAGIWCISCFDRAASKVCPWIEWAPLNQRHLLRKDIEESVANVRHRRNRQAAEAAR